MGTGWNHHLSDDLVHWRMGVHGPPALHETYAGMDSKSDPCSGFVTKDDAGRVCAGFRQCGSDKGVAGGAAWDVPLELRCAKDDNLTSWAGLGEIDYLFNVSWYRPIPYDPARPWQDHDGNWYVLLSMDACNATTRALPCASGGQLGMWRSPALRGPKAKWEHVGPAFTDNSTVLSGGHLTKEFVTIDFLGKMAGDPKPEGQGTRLLLDNAGGNGGGEGCCSGTTRYYVLSQCNPGAPFAQAAKQNMVDWGAFTLLDPPPPGARGIDLLNGVSSRGLSMARTLGSEEPNQVTKPGRRLLIGWTGPSPLDALGGQGSAQSLPRDLSLGDDLQLRQAFAPELQMLRREHTSMRTDNDSSALTIRSTQQSEALATFPPNCAAAGGGCGLRVFGLPGTTITEGTTIKLNVDKGLVVVDATSQGNADVRAGPLPPVNAAGGWQVHVYVDHCIVELIVNNVTALVVYAAPGITSAKIDLFGVPAGRGSEAATLDVWELATANE